MVKSGQAPESTYGGEVEMLAIRQGSGSLLPFEYALQRQVQTNRHPARAFVETRTITQDHQSILAVGHVG